MLLARQEGEPGQNPVVILAATVALT